MYLFRHNVLRVARLFAFGVAFCVLAACSRRDDLALLQITSVETVHRDGTEVLRLHGQGLPLGRDGSVTWTGTLRRPSLPSRGVVAHTAGRVVAMEVFEVPLTDEVMTAFLGGGTFEGAAQIAFDARVGGASIVGSLDEVRVWLRPNAQPALASTLARQRRVHALATFAGMSLSDEETTGGGVRVSEVNPSGAAARAGVLAGDVIVEVDDAFVDGLIDLLPQQDADRMQLRMRRPGEVAPISAWLSLGGFENQPPRADLWLALAALLFAFGSMVAFGPSTRASRQAVERVRQAWFTRSLGSAFVPSLVAVCVAAAMHIASALFPLAQHIWIWALVAVSARAAAHLASRQAATSWRNYRGLMDDVLALAAMIILGSLVGTWTMSSFGALQGERVWTWFAFRNPVSLVAAWVCIEAALVGTKRTLSDAATTFVRNIDRIHNAIFASLIVIMFFGGVHAPSSLDGAARWQWMVSAGVFAAKVWLLAALTERMRQVEGVRWRVLASTCLVCGLGLVVLLRIHVSAISDTLISELTAAGAALMLGWALVRAARLQKVTSENAIAPEPTPMVGVDAAA